MDGTQTVPAGGDIRDRFQSPEGITRSALADALWAWAAGSTAPATSSLRLVPTEVGTVFEGRSHGRPFAVTAVVSGPSITDCDLVLPAPGVSIELRPYARLATLTIMQATVLTLATAADWAALEEDAAVGAGPRSPLIGIASLHLFDSAVPAPTCPQQALLTVPRPVSDRVRRHVVAAERARADAVQRLLVTRTNQEWV